MFQGWGWVCHGGVGWGGVGCVMEGVCHGVVGCVMEGRGGGGVGVGCVMEGWGLSWRGGVGHIQSNLVIEANHHYLHTIPSGNYSKLLGEPNSITTTHLITWNY